MLKLNLPSVLIKINSLRNFCLVFGSHRLTGEFPRSENILHFSSTHYDMNTIFYDFVLGAFNECAKIFSHTQKMLNKKSELVITFT